MSNQTPERDYPETHPLAQDYKPGHFVAPESPLKRDFPVGHPKNAESPENLAETATRLADLERFGWGETDNEQPAPGNAVEAGEKAEAPDGKQPVHEGVHSESTGGDPATSDSDTAKATGDAQQGDLGSDQTHEPVHEGVHSEADHGPAVAAE
jgi:hypothetical protein